MTKIMIITLVIGSHLLASGCGASYQRSALAEACKHIDEIDTKTAELVNASIERELPVDFLTYKVRPLAVEVNEAHKWCFDQGTEE